MFKIVQKRIMAVILALAVTCSCVCINVTAAETADRYEYELISEGAAVEITGYNGSENVLVIPSTIEGLPVTGIGNYAFRDCTSLTSITIPNSVTSIGDWAFVGCTGLTSITIPNSVTSIEYGTFYDCVGLASITIPDSVTSIGGGSAFYNCTGLTIYGEYNSTAETYANMYGIFFKHISEFVNIELDIVTETLPTAKQYTPYDAEIKTNDDAATKSIASGTLPEGLTLTGGKITGIPAKTGTYTFSVKAENGNSSVTKEFSLTVSAPDVTNLGEAMQYQLFVSEDLKVSGEIENLVSGSLPAGLVFESRSNATVISGIPSEAGEFNFSVKTADGRIYVFSLGVIPTDSTSYELPRDENIVKISVINSDGTIDITDDEMYKVDKSKVTNLTMLLDYEFSQFTGLWINGKEFVRDTDYSVKEGSTVITLYGQTIKNLSDGKHVISASFKNENDEEFSASTWLNIVATETTETETPQPPASTDGEMEDVTIKYNGKELNKDELIQVDPNQPFTISIDIPYKDFRELELGGIKLVKDLDYTVEEGSTILTILPEALQKFEAGDYVLTASFEGQKVEIAISIYSGSTTDSPKTGVNLSTSIIITVVCLACSLSCRKKLLLNVK